MTSVPERSAKFVSDEGLVTPTWDAFLRSLVRDQKRIDTQLTSVDGAKAKTSQPFAEAAFIEFAEDKDYRFLALNITGTITEVVTQSTLGTCTVTVVVRSGEAETELSGGGSAVTTTEETIEHVADNALTPGDDIILRISSNSAAEGVSITLRGTQTLA